MNGGFYVLSFQDFVFTAKVDTDKIDDFIDIMNDLNRCFGFALMFHNDNQVIWRDMRSLTKNDYDPKKKKYSQGKWYKIAQEFIAIYEEQGYADRGERAEEFLQLIYMKILSIYDHDIHNFFKGLQEFENNVQTPEYDFFKKIWMMCDKMTLGNTVEKPEQVN